MKHPADGTFCRTLDRGVELWLLNPHTEPCLSHAPLGSPAGEPVFIAAVKDGNIVGKVIYLPIPLVLDHGDVPGAICMDLEILPGFRGGRLFKALVAEGVGVCRERGIHVILGLPNQNSYLPLVRKGGFRLLGVMPFRVKPVTLDSFCRQHIPVPFLAAACRTGASLLFAAYTWLRCGPGRSRLSVAESVAELDAGRVRPLLEHASRAAPCRVARTPDYFFWRYRHPEYFFISADDGTALLVGCCLQKEGRRVGFICDMLLDGSGRSLRSGRKLVQEAERMLRREKADMCVALFQDGTPQSAVLKKAGFFRVPERHMIRKMWVIIQDLADSGSPVLDFSRWSLAVSDFDVTPYYGYREMVLD